MLRLKECLHLINIYIQYVKVLVNNEAYYKDYQKMWVMMKTYLYQNHLSCQTCPIMKYKVEQLLKYDFDKSYPELLAEAKKNTCFIQIKENGKLLCIKVESSQSRV